MARQRPRRDDARRNREAILRQADAAFAEGPEVVPLEEIARRVGLARATVYRHFGDRRALAVEVAERNLAALRELVREGDRSCRDLLHRVFSSQASLRPLTHVFRELPVEVQRRYVETLIKVLTPSFRRAQADGHLRADAEPADLAYIFVMLDAVEEPVVVIHGEATVERLITVILDGLFNGGPSAEQALPPADSDR